MRLSLLALAIAAEPLAAQQPRKFMLPEPPTLTSKEPVSVAKLPDGRCDWGRMKFTPQPKGYASMLGVRDDSTCTGVVYHMKHEPRFESQVQTDSATFFAPRLPFEPPPPQDGGSDSAVVVNIVKRELARPTKPPSVRFGDVTIRGDSAWVTVWHTDTEGQTYWLEKRSGMWELASRRGPTRR